MISKLLILVMIASMAYCQDVYDWTPPASDKFPAKTWRTIDRINAEFNVMIFEKVTATRMLMNTLRNLTDQVICDQYVKNAGCGGFNSAELLERMKNAADSVLRGTSIAAGRDCSTGKAYQKKTHASLDTIGKSIGKAIQLAQDGKYYENEAEIKDTETALRRAAVSYSENIAELLDNCLNTDGRDDIKEVIQMASNGTRTNFLTISDTIYDAVKTYGTVDANENSCGIDHALTSIDVNRVNALAAVRATCSFAFSPIEALYLDRVPGGTKIVKYLYLNQYYEKIKFSYLNITYIIIATATVNTLENSTGVVEVGRQNWYPATLANEARAVIQLATEIDTDLDVIKYTQPSSSAKVDAFRRVTPNLNNMFATTWFGSIALAADNSPYCHVIPDKIKVIDKSQYPVMAAVTNSLFAALSNNETSGPDGIDPAISNSTVNLAIQHVQTANSFIYEAIEYLSKTICANRSATQADFMKIRDTLEQTTLEMTAYTNILYRVNLWEILKNHGYY